MTKRKQAAQAAAVEMALKEQEEVQPSELLSLPGERFLTIPNAAAWCGGISEARIRLALVHGELQRYKAGPGSHARTLVALSDLQKFVVKVA